MTTMFGYAMAPVELSASMLFWTTVGTAFCVTSANTLNQVCATCVRHARLPGVLWERVPVMRCPGGRTVLSNSPREEAKDFAC